MALKALIFGSLDTLADTHEIQRRAFNEAFDAAGLDWHWDSGTYDRLLDRAGNDSRLVAYAEQTGASLSDEQRDTIQRERIKRFAGLLDDMTVQPRPGVERLVNVALGEGRKVALVSAADREMVDAFRGKLGERLGMDRWAMLNDAASGGAPKPSADPYDMALADLGLLAEEVVAIEDTAHGVASANAAGLMVLATPTDWTREQDFDAASAVVDQLGDVGSPARSLRVPVAMTDNIVTLDWLEGLRLVETAQAA